MDQAVKFCFYSFVFSGFCAFKVRIQVQNFVDFFLLSLFFFWSIIVVYNNSGIFYSIFYALTDGFCLTSFCFVLCSQKVTAFCIKLINALCQLFKFFCGPFTKRSVCDAVKHVGTYCILYQLFNFFTGFKSVCCFCNIVLNSVCILVSFWLSVFVINRT